VALRRSISTSMLAVLLLAPILDDEASPSGDLLRGSVKLYKYVIAGSKAFLSDCAQRQEVVETETLSVRKALPFILLLLPLLV
jgi:hypothetical protein